MLLDPHDLLLESLNSLSLLSLLLVIVIKLLLQLFVVLQQSFLDFIFLFLLLTGFLLFLFLLKLSLRSLPSLPQRHVVVAAASVEPHLGLLKLLPALVLLKKLNLFVLSLDKILEQVFLLLFGSEIVELMRLLLNRILEVLFNGTGANNILDRLSFQKLHLPLDERVLGLDLLKFVFLLRPLVVKVLECSSQVYEHLVLRESF